MIISIDLGYGYTKGINTEGKSIVIPSVVGPGRDRSMVDNLGGEKHGMDNLHVVVNGEEYFVGSLAEEENLGASRTLDVDKISHINTKVLLSIVAALLMPKSTPEIHLTTGLPFADYVNQRKSFEAYLKFFNTDVEFKGGPLQGKRRHIRFDQVSIYPQAAGAIYSLMDNEMVRAITKTGKMVSVVDIGYKTTDFVTFQSGSTFKYKTDLSDTINVGMNEMNRLASLAFHKKTGRRINTLQADEIIKNRIITFAGQEWDFTQEIEYAYETVARNIIDRVRQIWGDQSDFIQTVFIAGGGAIALGPYLRSLHHNLQVAPDAQTANAKGFFLVTKAAERMNAKMKATS
ncbi:MAG: ParM/StbA family protein [Bacillota bacterium]